jgi:hypothetical protein
VVSPFQAAAAASSAAVDAVYGRRLRIVPMVRSQYGAAMVDPNRPVREVVGELREVPDRIKVTDAASKIGRDFDTAILGARTVATIDPLQLSGDVPVALDRIELLDDDGEVVGRYDIVNVETPGGRIIMPLTKAAA